MARAYHNPYVREGQWTRMFDRRLPAVVSMNHQYLAKYDGSEMAEGRGLGAEKDPRAEREERESRVRRTGGVGRDTIADPVERRFDGRPEKTPYMHMTFYPLERRLDTAIWRALFASSARQARQFVTHGWVKVNGKRMIYPGYQLNPGDMFSVDPERVMFATGARKKKRSSPVSDGAEVVEAEQEDGGRGKRGVRGRDEDDMDATEADAEDSDAGAATLESDEEREAMSTKPEDEQDAKKALKNLITRAKRILEDSKRQLSGKRQQELRAFAQSVRKTMSKHGGAETAEDSPENLEAALAEIMTKIPSDVVPTQPTSAEATVSNPQMRDPEKTDEYAARKDALLLHEALEKARQNPIDAAKPYATPWRPRAFMSAFAFIPRYLEVNQNVCSAVYLRHPVARAGLAEVPTPFGKETMELAFNWYLRRR